MGARGLSAIEQTDHVACQLVEVMDCLTQRYGRSGSGRASILRLVGAYMIFQTEGAAGFRKRGFSRDSVQLYREKLREAGVHVK